MKLIKWVKDDWGIGIWLERWCWCFSYQEVFGAHTFFLPFGVVILYTPSSEEDDNLSQ